MINEFSKLSKNFDSCEKDTNSNQETITVNKSKLIDEISNLLIAGFMFGVMIGATIMQLIIRF